MRVVGQDPTAVVVDPRRSVRFCAWCGQAFVRRRKQYRPDAGYCSARCGLGASQHRRWGERVDVAEIRRLYVDLRWPSTRIAARFGIQPTTVLDTLAKLGISRRPSVSYVYRCRDCGRTCDRPRVQRCRIHRRLRAAAVARDSYRRRRGIPPERWRLEKLA